VGSAAAGADAVRVHWLKRLVATPVVEHHVVVDPRHPQYSPPIDGTLELRAGSGKSGLRSKSKPGRGTSVRTSCRCGLAGSRS
jgi:hypothetical protein